VTGLKWSRRTTDKVAVLLSKLGIFVSPNTVARLLRQMGYSLRINHKMLPSDSSPDRNQQFEYISEIRTSFQRRHHPIISVDSKKRELTGNFKNPGTSAPTPSALPFHMGFMIFLPIAAQFFSASPMTRPVLPPVPLRHGCVVKACFDIQGQRSC
jgi:hypothetical protein